ncbi:hypothetical protein BVX99_01810, partial [bacterium F16]
MGVVVCLWTLIIAAEPIAETTDIKEKGKAGETPSVVLDGHIDPKEPPPAHIEMMDVPDGGKVMILELKDQFDPILL